MITDRNCLRSICSLLPLLFFFAAVDAQTGVKLTASDTAEVRYLNNRKFFIYRVGKGESIFSIAQKFRIPQDELQELNPDLKHGLKSKMKLWIPAYSWKKKAAEQGSENSDKVIKRNPHELRIAVIVGLSLQKQFLEESLPSDSTAAEEVLEEEVLNGLLFSEGVQYAADRAVSADPKWKLKLSIIDAGGDTSSLLKALIKPGLKEYDAFLTNLNGSQLRTLNRWCSKEKVRLLSVAVNSTEPIRHNAQAIALLPSSLLQCNRAGTLTAKRFPGANVILIKTALPRENERSAEFREGWLKQYEQVRFRSYDYTKHNTIALSDSLAKSKHNVIFLPSSNEEVVTAVLSKVKELRADREITVVGLPTWMQFETIDAAILESAGVELFTAAYLDPDFSDQPIMRKVFREKYAAEPEENALLGADAMDLLLNGWKKSGTDFPDDRSLSTHDGRYTDYRFVKTESGSCLENMNVRIWEFKDRKPVELGR